jgi:hypothetical protein
MSVQDDVREDTMILLFNLEQEKERKRHEADAYLVYCDKKFLFELKSTTTGSLSTVRDFGRAHIAKWAEMHWIIGFYKGKAKRPDYCQYLTPDDMREWTDRIWEYVKVDYAFADIAASRIDISDLHALVGEKNKYSLRDAKRIQKNQYSADEYIAKMDFHEGVSEQQLSELCSPLVGTNWLGTLIDKKQLYSVDDVSTILRCQANTSKIKAALKPDSLITEENAHLVCPPALLNRGLPAPFPLPPKELARELRSLASKMKVRMWIDVEGGYSPAAMLKILKDRCRYLIERGSTLNNPHIPPEFFERFDRITDEHAKVLRQKLDQYLTEKGQDQL